MNSDTALGETAGVEYKIGGSYTKVLGTYNTSYPGANWYADIPAQSAGTTVEYQLFTRNQSGEDYGYTGFNWSYTVDDRACAGASVGNDAIYWSGLFHDSFSTAYRSPGGPVTTGQGSVTLSFRTCAYDVSAASVRVWNDGLTSGNESFVTMTAGTPAMDPALGPVTTWTATLPIPSSPTILYYVFRATDGSATAYYRDDDPKFYGGGFGQAEGNQNIAYEKTYQLTVYDPSFAVPSWMQSGVAYQIFPDRFRDGDSANNPAAGRFSYNMPGGAIVRSNQSDWNYTVCDPRSTYDPSCAGKYGDNFYGGDLRGIIQKLEDGYFINLGVSVLYLNPIFYSPSNHKYDTADFLAIDPDFGTLADFQELTDKAEARGIKVILDGVFNHTSSDSKYFDHYKRYDSSGALTSSGGPGSDDNSGACESPNSPYRSWYTIGGSPSNPPAERCDLADNDDPGGAWDQQYEAWYGYGSLPKLQANLPAVRGLIWSNGLSSVGPYWTQKGADGWRFDVGGDVDPGLTNDPTNDYWEGFRSAVRDSGVTGKSDTLMLGEEWGDASAWLLGNEWDSVMNYRFRSALLGWFFYGCNSGSGCTNPGATGSYFEENDSNAASSSGVISYVSPSQFNARLRSIAEDYPPMALKTMMNLAGSHDTNRIRFLLKKINNNQDWAAVQRMKEWWIFAFTYPGAPTLYYGDEIGLSHDGVWDGSTWQDDPYNRAPFPWPGAGGASHAADTGLQVFARQMASIRWSYRALQDGDVQHGLVIDNGNKLYGYARTDGSQTALILLNRDSSTHTATFSGLNVAPYNLANGTVLVNVLEPATTYTVNGGSVSVSVNPTWGVVLLERNKIDTPAAMTGLTGSWVYPNAVLTWAAVTADTAGNRELVTAYQIQRSADPGFTAYDTIGTVSPSDEAFRYGSAGGTFSFASEIGPNVTYYYRVCPVNAPGIQGACSAAAGPLAVMLAEFSAAQASDAVVVTWQTASELDNRGFNLWRGTSEAGPDRKLNEYLIPSKSQGLPGSGFEYTWEDRAGLVPGATYWYWLEDLDVNGSLTRHDPISAAYATPTAVGLAAFGARYDGGWAGLYGLLALAALGGVALRRRRMKDEG